MKNRYSDGKTIRFTATKNILSGDAVIINDIVVIATNPILKGEEGIGYSKGVFELLKKKLSTFNQGQSIFINKITNDLETVKNDKNILLGYAWEKAGENEEDIMVKLR